MRAGVVVMGLRAWCDKLRCKASAAVDFLFERGPQGVKLLEIGEQAVTCAVWQVVSGSLDGDKR